MSGRLSCGFGSGRKVCITAWSPSPGGKELLWQPGGEGKENSPRDAGRLSWDVISYYSEPRLSLNNYLYAQSARGPFSWLFALGRWMNTMRWIRGSLPIWLNIPTSSAVCWFRRKMHDSWGTCEQLLLSLCVLEWSVFALQAEKEHKKPCVIQGLPGYNCWCRNWYLCWSLYELSLSLILFFRWKTSLGKAKGQR